MLAQDWGPIYKEKDINKAYDFEIVFVYFMINIVQSNNVEKKTKSLR